MDSEGRIVELDDDPMIEASGSATPREAGNESSGRETEVGRPKRKEVGTDHSQGLKSGSTTATHK